MTSHSLPVFLAVLLLRVTSSAQSWRDEKHPVNFLVQCMAGMSCQGLRCSAEEGGDDFSLELLQALHCQDDSDCSEENTGLQCVKGGCECPAYQALNVSACQCQPAALCEEKCAAQHNGRRCEDEYCSCYPSLDFTTLLVDPASLFCVLPATDPVLVYGTAGLTVLCVLGGLTCAVLLIVLGLVLHRNCVCEKGDYKCEDEPDLPQLPHVAAWDHPSLDYIPRSGEEDIVFTLALAKDTVRMSNASTIHVVDEDMTDYNENKGYVDDVEDPRHD
jgi:hypothetical protein